MTAILGFNAFHANSAACLVLDGKLVGAIAEERLGDRVKHCSRFPENAIRWLLAENGLRLSDVDYLAVPRDTAANRAAKIGYVLSHPGRGIGAAIEHFRRRGKTASRLADLPELCGEGPASARYRVVPVEHHLAHIASAYYCSPFEGLTAGLSYDGSGDFVSAMAAQCEGTKIEVLDRVALPHSLGFFYTAFCQFIGFNSFGEEYKVMGLAPYGEDAHADLMREVLILPDDGWFRLDERCFGTNQANESGKMTADGRLLLDLLYTDELARRIGPPAARGALTQREKDIARSLQVRFEEAALHCLRRLHGLVPAERLVMAGGCALNGVANARILRETPFTQPYLQAAASDDGTCLGAAMWVWHNVCGGAERFHMEHAFWGPRYGEARMRAAVESAGAGVSVRECRDLDETIAAAAELIAGGDVVGWYQGRSEWGPRALGNRSILANPAVPDMKEVINTKIKRRESFRPFAPSVLREDVPEYFEQDVFSPFMMHVVKIREKWRARLPAITHVDGTGRLQSVDRASNPTYHALISAVKRHTGIGVVLNTSFNENEPVVDTPEQALACFLRTDMDALCLGNFLLRKGATPARAPE